MRDLRRAAVRVVGGRCAVIAAVEQHVVAELRCLTGLPNSSVRRSKCWKPGMSAAPVAERSARPAPCLRRRRQRRMRQQRRFEPASPLPVDLDRRTRGADRQRDDGVPAEAGSGGHQCAQTRCVRAARAGASRRAAGLRIELGGRRTEPRRRRSRGRRLSATTSNSLMTTAMTRYLLVHADSGRALRRGDRRCARREAGPPPSCRRRSDVRARTSRLPGRSRSGSSMPLAAAIACQSGIAGARRQRSAGIAGLRRRVSGGWPGGGGTRPSPLNVGRPGSSAGTASG